MQQGVRVNAINPGLVAIDRFTRNVERVMHERGFNRDEALTYLVSSDGTTRVGQPEEIGAMVAYYLASSKADFVQGAISMAMAARLDRCREAFTIESGDGSPPRDWGSAGRRQAFSNTNHHRKGEARSMFQQFSL